MGALNMLAGYPSELVASFQQAWEKVAPFTMTSPERGFALWTAVNSIVDNDISGALVECGVWKGGSSMLIALALLERGVATRDLYLFDTFEGMTIAGEGDVDLNGEHASALMKGSRGPAIAELVKAAASLEDVRANIASTGYDMRLVRLVKGDVCETLSKIQTLSIGLLRLDTDFYDSTLAELRHLYPRLVQGGIIIIDDYGHWQGARRAVTDYFEETRAKQRKPTLWAFDYTGWGGVKLEPATEIEISRYDYTPPGFATPPNLMPIFPDALPVNPWTVNWPYLRSSIPHMWRSDSRDGSRYTIGNASYEEVTCLYNLAALFAGKRGVEIGTHFGWTGAHLLSAGLRLDCIDPALADGYRAAAIRAAFDSVEGAPPYRLWSGFSPGILGKARDAEEEPWSFAFIDGNHDGDAPAADAEAMLAYLADDALVVFHDLTSPFVERGLDVFRRNGFQVKLYNTMQILGIAWRGDTHPPEHIADQNIPPIFMPHLSKYI